MKELHLNCSAVKSRSELHEQLQTLLQLPEWYGRNLDALHDCLTDIFEDTCLILDGYETLLDSMGPYSHRFFQLLKDADEENPHFTAKFN